MKGSYRTLLVRRTLALLVVLLAFLAVAAGLVWSRPYAATATGVAAVGAGGSHSCALTPAGGVRCWGANSSGQLGDGAGGGANELSTRPVGVSGLDSGVAAIGLGGAHTCVVTTSGGVQCWGENFQGQLGATAAATCEKYVGLPPVACALTPVDVQGLQDGVAAVPAGRSHSCALTTAGGVKCWGANFSGQLGAQTVETCGLLGTPCATTPVDVPGLSSGVVALAAGTSHTCALTMAGGVKCWGLNSSGQLGAPSADTCGPSPCSRTPLDVCADTACTAALAGVVGLAAGPAHTCARMMSGGVKCWGGNATGELGQGTSDLDRHPVPTDVCANDACSVGLTLVAAITAGGVDGASSHTCALLTDGSVRCWGGNFDGELGDRGACGYWCTTPVQVSGLTGGVVAVAAGAVHTCAFVAGGVKCWGNNASGQLGDGTTTNRDLPVDVSGQGPKGTGTPPATPTRTPTPSPTPAARCQAGDVNLDGSVSSVDAALVLQRVAGLLRSLICEEAADANRDGAVTSVDAALILQVVAGLLDGLPP